MDEKELKQELMVLEQETKSLRITDKASFEIGSEITIKLKDKRKMIVDYWKTPKDMAFQAHKEITRKEKEMLDPIDDKLKFLSREATAFLTEQERVRREEQRRVDEARRAAEQKERERLAKLAEKAEAKGQDEKADALREKIDEVFIAPVVVVPEVEKTSRLESGTVSQRKETVVTITSELEIIKCIASGRLPIGIITINQSKLKTAITMMGAKEMPGCIIEEVISASYRSKS